MHKTFFQKLTNEGGYDKVLAFASLLLWVFGLFAVYSATRTLGGYSNILVQSAAGILGIGIMIGICCFDYRQLIPFIKLIAGACVFLLLLVVFAGFEGVWGSKSWIKAGPVSIQPSECVKFGFIITFAYHISKVRHKINKPQTLTLVLAHAFVPVFLVMLQPDFGTAMVFVFICICVLFSAGISYKYILGGLGVFSALAPFLYMFLDEYQKKRIKVFLNPETDPLGAGYNVIRSKTALGSGGAVGQGYLQGISTQRGLLPAKHTDFIFSCVSEEFGFFISIMLVAVLFLLIWRIVMVAKRSHTYFGRFICIGVASMLFFHVFENIGMCMGIMPVTGIPLPFISYGGSALVVDFASVGLVLSVDRMSRPARIFGVF